ncbi:MAG: Rne/Rng family ribonuclease [Rhodospirillales bacterium]|nr:Rne/Rng family ribonuclease [Rhodospirillales bacterium]MCW8861273.1 Rne/Rng family ribonuclease [Rhodospirillales bacterium]MCW8952829.1 Rne/Rng family ribonuclease [Rhodospirillales bacterium]
MPNKRMLIDATHPEETRVVVISGNRLEELDVESANRKQLKGNIYLAKVTRVEPSLQAAFVDYGGNRHGFLPFSEIHPDYYQIPVADREALLEAEHQENHSADESDGEEVDVVGGDDAIEEEEFEARRRAHSSRDYKIQEVVKRRQVILVQVVKEERGNKGAALTTYISLAGRYCVLMPNTGRGGGISRKIGSAKDRKRLRSVLSELKIPGGMAVIVRTAGAERSKAEVKRDYEYLIRLWDNVRKTTLESTAPNLVYEEASLIKRSIRDLYSKDIDEIIIEGDEGYRTAKDLMKMLVPSHTKRVQPYKDEMVPLFHRYQVESQLDAMHSPVVQLKSGGYIVINPTEALVAIDVNSGRATKERNIEETALKTNVEAAEEIARQLRLRDLAGLIVIDFIDMEGTRNQATVERKLKDAMRIDRARIQIGRISHFGLLEMSRQRLRPSLQETSSESCPFCAGAGVRRSIESTALHVLRSIEEEGIRRRTAELHVHAPSEVALYMLNQKRAVLLSIEARYNMLVLVKADDDLIQPDFRSERIRTLESDAGESAETAAPMERPDDPVEADGETAAEGGGTEEGVRKRRRRRPRRRKRGVEGETTAEGTEQNQVQAADDDGAADEETEKESAAEGAAANEAGEEGDANGDEIRKRRRRGKRGGRRRRKDTTEAGDEEQEAESGSAQPAESSAEPAVGSSEQETVPADTDQEAASSGDGDAGDKMPEKAKAPRRRSRKKVTEEETSSAAETAPDEEKAAVASSEEAVEEPAKPAKATRTRRRAPAKKAPAEVEQAPAETSAADEASGSETDTKEKPARKPRTRKASTAKKPAAKDKSDGKDEAPSEAPVAPSTAKEPEPVAEAPKPERQVPATVIAINPDGTTEEVAAKGQRRGWWSRG